MDWPHGPSQAFLHRPAKSQETKKTRYGWALEGSTTILFLTQPFLHLFFLLFTYVLFFPLLSLPLFTPSLFPVSSSSTSLQLLSCVLPLYTSRCWSTMMPQLSGLLDMELLPGRRQRQQSLPPSGFTGTYDKIPLLSQTLVSEAEKTQKHTWEPPGSPRNIPFPFRSQPCPEPHQSPHMARESWVCAWKNVLLILCTVPRTVKLWFTYHKGWSV